MTRNEAKVRFITVTSAEEMADLMLDCLKILGPDETENMLIEIQEEQSGVPYFRN